MPTEILRRRRIAAALCLLVALAITLTGGRAFAGWFSADDAAASPGRAAAAPTGPDCGDADDAGSATTPVPADLRSEIDDLLAHPDVAGREVSVSVWVEGWGEVAGLSPDLALRPASNQKILTAVGALELLDHDQRLVTSVRATAPVDGGRLDGDLVLVGGGDPTLWDVGPHSIYQLAVELRELGVEEVTGGLYVDDSRYDSRRMAQGWTDQQIPGDAAPISALTVAANRLGDEYAYLADPASGNAEVFGRYLSDVGIAVGEGFVSGEPPEASVELVRTQSPTVAELVGSMLRNSDNTTAELLLKEIGLQVSGEGSTLAGLDAARGVVEGWCVELSGHDDDGSGLSYRNTRSAREWREMLLAAQRQDWWPVMLEGLPLAGSEDGTLANRLTDPATDGNVRAKTGTIDVARALSGVFTTAGGRTATFSIIINDPVDPAPAVGPTDRLVEAVAAHPG